MARDLFDHKIDPDENVNISNDPDQNEIIEELSRLLNRGKGWRTIAAELN
jgi:hypothetical protein